MADNSALYDISASLAASTANSTPQGQNAGTVFNFSSPGASGDWYDQNLTGSATADATAATKSPGASGGSIGVGFGSGGLSTNQILIAGGVLVAMAAIVAAAIYFKR